MVDATEPGAEALPTLKAAMFAPDARVGACAA